MYINSLVNTLIISDKQNTNSVQLRAEVVDVNALVCKAVLLLATKHVDSTTLHTANHVFSRDLQHAYKLLQLRNKYNAGDTYRIGFTALVLIAAYSPLFTNQKSLRCFGYVQQWLL